MKTVFAWLPKSRAVSLLILLLFQLNGTVGLADDNLGLSVSSMPLSVFASAIEESMSVSIEVDEAIADLTIEGQFNGPIEALLSDLYDLYEISHTETDYGFKLWRDANFATVPVYQFLLSDMEIVAFLTYLSEAAGYSLIADTSMSIKVNGAFNGTMQEIINVLSHHYPVLFNISEDTISVVPESSFEKKVIPITNEQYSSETFLTDLRTKLPPGNFVNRQDDELIVGGHPDFVRLTSLQIQVDMSAAASQASELVTAQFPLITEAAAKTQLDNIEPILSEISAEDGRSELVQDPDAATTEAETETETETTVLVEPDVMEPVDSSEPDSEVSVTPEADAAVPESEGVFAAPTEPDLEAKVTSTLESDLEELSADKDVQDVNAVDDIPGFY